MTRISLPMPQVNLLSVVGLIVCASVCIDLAPCAMAQGRKVPEADSQPQVFLPTDRLLSRGIRRAQERLQQGEYSQAIRFLDDVLATDQEDFFILTGADNEYAGLKETARQIIRSLPPEGKALYQATYGPVAKRELGKARSTGDLDTVRRIAYRYFYTDAGYEAALLLAQNQTDLGRHLSAALLYEELRNSEDAAQRFEPQLSLLTADAWIAVGDTSKAEAVLRQLGYGGFRSATIAGKEIRLDNLATSPLDWMGKAVGSPVTVAMKGYHEWLTFRGNSRRNGHAEGGLPHMRQRWAVRLLTHPDLEDFHETLANDKIRNKKNVPVAASPLAVGDYIITRSAHNLIAVDYRTGKRVWRSQPQRVPAFEQLTSKTKEPVRSASKPAPIQTLNERLWHDYLYNSFSSDGERVFVVRDLTLPKNLSAQPLAGLGMRTPHTVGPTAGTNRLCAYELASQGKLVWEADGALAQSELSGAFFLGAPLCVGQALYGLAEIKSAIYLVALDRRTGEYLWKQQLVGLEADILLDNQRRLQAAVPSYDSGMLVCPTGAGVVIGVDLAKQALSWAYHYSADRNVADLLRARIDQSKRWNVRWTDTATIIDSGKVLLSPPESKELHCLDLVTGEIVWKTERSKSLWIAGVHDKKVLLIGNSHLVALNLDDGKPAWVRGNLALPKGALPSGRGFFSGDTYYLPLTSAEVFGVDIETGEFTGRATSREGQVLGNLICHRGSILSQTGRYLNCFDMVEVLRKQAEESLAENPQDVEALRVLGEIAYNEGKLDQAIEYLQHAWQGAEDSMRTKDVLIECLQGALTKDFAAYQNRLPLLRELIRSAGTGESQLLRIEAQGLLELGDFELAFEKCMELYEASEQPEVLQAISRDHHTSTTQWIRAHTAAIIEQASPELRQEFEDTLLMMFAKVQKDPSQTSLQRFADSFGNLEVAELALFQLAERQLAAGDVHLAQQIYLRLEKSDDLQTRAASIARVSEILHEQGLQRLAIEYDRQLGGELRDVVCLNGKTGKECLDQWGPSTVRLTGLNWPQGEVEASTILFNGKQSGGHVPVSRIRLERTDSILGPCSVLTSTRTSGKVDVRDSVGTKIFSADTRDPQRVQAHDISNFYGVSRGNLLVVSQGNQLIAFNTLSDGVSSEKQVLWKKSVLQGVDLESPYQYRVVVSGQRVRQFGPSKAPRASRDSQWIGVIGPVTYDRCVFQDQRRLMCVDSMTGDLRWWRSDVPPGCDLYGDDQYVLAVPPGGRKALVYSTIDGRFISEVTVPRWEEQMATLGRNFIRWRRLSSGEQELSARDAFTEEVLWRKKYKRGTRADITQGRYVAIAEPKGKCQIVDVATGEVLVDHQLEVARTLRNVYVLAGSDNFVVVTEQPFKTSRERRIMPLNRWDYRVIEGEVYTFSRSTGELAWEGPAEVKQESFILSQPVDLPVIAFAGTVHHRTRSGGRAATSLLLLEKSTGRLLFHEEKLPQTGGNYFEMRMVDEKEAEMEVRMASRTVRVKFTDKPRSPEPPAVVDSTVTKDKESGGLLEIGKKLLGQ